MLTHISLMFLQALVPAGNYAPSETEFRWATGEEMAMIPPELGDRCFPAQTLASLLRDQGVEKAVLLQGGLYGFQNDATIGRCQSISGFVHPQRNLRSLLRPGRRSG